LEKSDRDPEEEGDPDSSCSGDAIFRGGKQSRPAVRKRHKFFRRFITPQKSAPNGMDGVILLQDIEIN
jgi:hypothetical protein